MEGYCPNCGSALGDDAVSCPECGSCEDTGWSDRARYDSIGVDYDPEEFDYDRFVESEFGTGQKRGGGRPIWWSVVAIILVIILLSAFF